MISVADPGVGRGTMPPCLKINYRNMTTERCSLYLMVPFPPSHFWRFWIRYWIDMLLTRKEKHQYARLHFYSATCKLSGTDLNTYNDSTYDRNGQT